MWAYNKYQIGDIVTHAKAKHLAFIIAEILFGEPETEGDYAYGCHLIYGTEIEFGQINHYLEKDISLIRKASVSDLKNLLKESLHKEDYDSAAMFQSEIAKLEKKEFRN